MVLRCTLQQKHRYLSLFFPLCLGVSKVTPDELVETILLTGGNMSAPPSDSAPSAPTTTGAARANNPDALGTDGKTKI
jgi:hypothetical protein